jgi:hypothetical protein
MAMFSDVGGVPFVGAMTGGHDSGHDKSFGWGWIFALVIIFLALVFLWGRKGDGDYRRDDDGILKYAAMNQLGGKNYEATQLELWDHCRDDLKEFATLRTELKDSMWTLSRENDRNHYETSRQLDGLSHRADLNTRDVLSATEASERRIMERLAYDREKRLEDERDALRIELSQVRFHPRPAYPGYGYGPSYDTACA